MKKIIILLLTLVMLASALTACGEADNKDKDTKKEETTVADEKKDTEGSETTSIETSVVPPEKT